MRFRQLAFVALACALPLVAAAEESPAELSLRAAGARLAAAPDAATRADAFIALAVAHTQRARESGDAAGYERSLAALAEARRLAPGNVQAGKVEAWVRLGRHEFATAAALAQQHCAARPDDAESWGLLGDALMELGRSEAAGDAYQRMMDLRPGPGAYQRAAFWRERAGDAAGARELLGRALASTGGREREQRAWIHVQLAALAQRSGDAGAAESALEQALASFPGYHFALAAQAQLELERGRFAAALESAQRALAAAPHPERRLLIADALRGLARETEAREQEDAFLREALANAERADNENLFLVDFFLDRRPDPARALAIAQREAAKRRDPGTLERLARSLARNGRSEEARRIEREAKRALLPRTAQAAGRG